MPTRRRSPLFTAVVVAGAALTQAMEACGGEVDAPEPASDDASVADAARSDVGVGGFDAGPRDASSARDAARIDAGTCPDGSDMPTPPCVLIK